MKHSVFLKGTTLLFFISLLTGFLFYRSGKFEKYFLKKPAPAINSLNSVAENADPEFVNDTVPVDSIEKLRMFSSKSMVLTERKIKHKKAESTKKKTDKTFFSSSKSGPPFSAEDMPFDSLFIDSVLRTRAKSKTEKKQ